MATKSTIQRVPGALALCAGLLSALGILCATPAHGADVSFGTASGFAWASPLIDSNGTAHAVNTPDGQVMRLTDNVGNEAGSAFFMNPFVIGHNTDFDSSFVFQITSDPSNPIANRSDGLAFIIGGNPTALGNAGAGMGYGASPALAHSVIVEFDTYQNGYDPSGSHVALTTDAHHTSALYSVNTPLPMDNGDHWSALIHYFGNTDFLSVHLADLDQPGVSAGFGYTLDVANTLGCGAAGCVDAYFGFSAGTGLGYANHDMLSWTLTVPEPASLTLWGAALTALLLTTAVSQRRRPWQRPSWHPR
jgi:hypothetical protein